MIIKIPYGKEKITLDIPDKNIQDIISEKENSFFMNEKSIIDEALKNPIGSVKLSELSKGSKNACIIISDITRHCPSYKFLPQLIKELNEGGIKNRNIRIIIGLGIHRKHSEDEKRKLVGDIVYNNIETIDFDITKTTFIGHTSFGTPVEVFDEVFGYDLLIVTGNIEYHYFAGYSGGAKAIMPGICSRNSIQSNHAMMLNDKAVSGNFFDNPVRQDIEETGKLLGINFIFNAIVDDTKKIISAVAGKNNEAYIEEIKKYDAIYKKEVEQSADIVITSQGGYPKDLNLYQSQKALENVKELVSEKGTIVLVASCNEGFGEDVFEEWMKYVKDFEFISQRLTNNFVLGGHKAAAISRLLTKADVLLYSNFKKNETEKMGFKKITDIQAYLNRRISHDRDLKITIVPNGRFVSLRK